MKTGHHFPKPNLRQSNAARKGQLNPITTQSTCMHKNITYTKAIYEGVSKLT